MATSPKQIVLGGLLVGVLTQREWASYIISHCSKERGTQSQPKLIFAANGQVIAACAINSEFRRYFRCADAVTADGQPLVWASKRTRQPLPERAATTDLFHEVATVAEKDNLSFFLLGATETNNAMASAVIQTIYPKLRIIGQQNGYFKDDQETQIVLDINRLKPDILWVGMGMLKQTEFAVHNKRHLGNVGCIITCGGLFDYFDEKVRRAPIWMQRHSLEWLFRAWQDPRKYLWRYILTNPVALWLLLTKTPKRFENHQSSLN